TNEFSFGKVNLHKNKGTATLTVNVPGPGALDLAKRNKVNGAEGQAGAQGRVKLLLKPKGRAKRRLDTKGKAKVTADVTFSPEGGTPNTKSKRIKLVKR